MKLLPIVFATTLLPLVAHAADAMPPEKYVIKEGFSANSSLLRRDEVRVGSVPMNRTWAQLSAAQKNTVKAAYEAMAEDDEPPYPIDGPEILYKVAAAAQKKAVVSGELYVVADVNSEGIAENAAIIKAPFPEMGEFIAKAMLLQKYKPALCKGKPCKMQYALSFKFVVD